MARTSFHPRPVRRSGLTLVEMLVAMALTLIMMAALTEAFKMIGDSVTHRRATIEMNTQLRSTVLRLGEDLEGLTVAARPWPSEGSGMGYLEIYEGPQNDSTAAISSYSLFGDVDDVLAGTTRTTSDPFTGRFTEPYTDTNTNGVWDSGEPFTDLNGNGVRDAMELSRVAEVIWWCRYNDRDSSGTFTPGDDVTLHRRVLLVRPDVSLPAPVLGETVGAYVTRIRSNFDISCRLVTMAANYAQGAVATTTQMVPNSLADLTQRENRFAHHISFPGRLQLANTVGGVALLSEPFIDGNSNGIYTAGESAADLNGNGAIDSPVLGGATAGEDVVLSHVIGFDLRVFDPTAPVRTSLAGELVTPGDLGFSGEPFSDLNGNGVYDAGEPFIDRNGNGSWNAGFGSVIGQGAYVDLGYGTAASTFSGGPQVKSRLNFIAPSMPMFRTWDSWSEYYEHDGIDQNVNSLVDEGTDGLDNDSANGTDDVGERETSPPYPAPLRGLQVRIRMIEHDTRQIRQATVVSNFVPE